MLDRVNPNFSVVALLMDSKRHILGRVQQVVKPPHRPPPQEKPEDRQAVRAEWQEEAEAGRPADLRPPASA